MKNGKDSSSEDEEENRESQSNNPKEKKDEKKEKKMLNKKRKKEKSEEEDEKKNKNDDIIVGENEVKFILDDKKRITVHKFKGKIKVDIREFYEDKGEMKPGKKGISLSLENWEKLKGFIDDIDESADNLK